MILGTPIITQLKPYTTNLDGIHTNILGKGTIFSSINSISITESDLQKN